MDNSGKYQAINGSRWYSTHNVIRVLFYAIFSGLLIWGTYVFAMASNASEKAVQATADNRVQDEQIKTLKETANEIKVEQRTQTRKIDEILHRLPR